MGFELSIALRHLRSSKSKGLSLVAWLSIIGVAAGVAALVGGFSVTSGFNKAFAEKLLGVTAHVKVMRPSDPVRVMTIADKIPGIISSSPATQEQALVTGPGGSVGSIIKGIDRNRAGKTLGLDSQIIQGRLTDLRRKRDGEAPTIILGEQLARSIGAKVGDVVSLLSPSHSKESESWGTVRGTPKMRSMRVVALYRSGYYEFDRLYAYTDLAESQDFFDLGSRVAMVELRVKDPNQATRLANELRDKINLPFSRVLDWRTSNSNLFVSLTMQRIAILLVLAVMVILAGCNVASMLIMMVIERTRDIAILKAMGARNGSIRRVFLLEGAFIAFIGVLGGMAVAYTLFELVLSHGVRLDPTVYGIDRLPILFNVQDYLLAGLGAMVITLSAALVPSIKAARYRPVDGLRDPL
ncbi:MAG: ABC transporter permease [Myxococcota bacterium]|nr:ABC transporter permease [Myxococcota bacterium]